MTEEVRNEVNQEIQNMIDKDLDRSGDEFVWKVYVHTVPKEISDYDHDKHYVGITSQTAYARWQRDGYGYRYQYFYRAIQKYGWDNLKHEVLIDNLSEKECKDIEIYLIDKLNSTDKYYGYNLSTGGDGTRGIRSFKFIDLTGKKFGSLTVTRLCDEKYYSESCRGMLQWYCDCDCGTKDVLVLGTNLKTGNTKHCYKCKPKTKITPNTVVIHGDYVEMDIQGNMYLFDLDFYDEIKKYRWEFSNNMIFTEYGRADGRRQYLYIKSMIFGYDPHYSTVKIKINFLNGDKFDYRRSNIEQVFPEFVDKDDYICFIKDKLTGVYCDSKTSKWVVKKIGNNKGHSFKTYQEARDYRLSLAG